MDVTTFNIYVKEHPEIDRQIENSAAEYAKSRGGKVIGFSGFGGGKLKELSDINVNIPSTSYEQIEDLHMMLTHIIVCYFKALGLE